MINFIKKNKPAFVVFLFFIILFFGLAYFGFYFQKQQNIDLNAEKLQILANEKAAQANLFFELQKEILAVLGSLEAFREVVLRPEDTAKIAGAKKMIDSLKNIIPGIGILTKEGIIIVAENNPAGTDYSGLPVFPMDEKSGIVFTRYYDQQRKKDYYGIGGPIYDGQDKNKVIGSIAFDIELEKISDLMEKTFESKTNEVYLIDGTGLLLSGSEYVDGGGKKGILVQEVKSDAAKECLEDLDKYQENGFVQEHEEEFPKYLNYMGNEVFGAHAYVTNIMGCVIAEEASGEVADFSLTDYIFNLFNIKLK